MVSIPKKCEILLYILVSFLVIEGLLRKLLPSAVGAVLFFTKDILCFYGIFLVGNIRRKSDAGTLLAWWKWLGIALIPLILYTGLLDPPLAVFGAKQYLLFCVVGVLVPCAFLPWREGPFRRFVCFTALLVIPTFLIAAIQLRLPASHWLNLSVAGESLEGFSAAGYLRVSSTFSFTGQYSYFLNVATTFVLMRLFMPPPRGKSFGMEKVPIICLIGSLLCGAFITGGRTAVLGCGAVATLGSIFLAVRSPMMVFSRGIPAVVLLLLLFFGIKAVNPEYFAAYESRSEGFGGVSQSEEIQDRLSSQFFGWTEWFWKRDASAIMLGGGLGVMSNGSDKISSYAREIRGAGFWTETDTENILWEGGIYLLIAWYGFRLLIIYKAVVLWASIKRSRYSFPAASCLGYIVIIGIVGTLGIQPPLAIWWWLAVGSIITLRGFDLAADVRVRREESENPRYGENARNRVGTDSDIVVNMERRDSQS